MVAASALGKRTNGNAKGAKSAKKQKLSNGKSSISSKSKGNSANLKGKGKEHAFERPHIPIPKADESSDGDVSEEDLEFFAEHIQRDANFLTNLDEKGLARSKKELDRLHSLSKPQRKPRVEDDDLPSLDSHDEDEDSWSSGMDDEIQMSGSESDSSSSALPAKRKEAKHDSSDEEMPYEKQPRVRRKSWNSDGEDEGIERLPIKLQDGRLQRSGIKIVQKAEKEEESDSDGTESEDYTVAEPLVEDVAIGARFGRVAVTDVVSLRSRKARIQAAKEQIAGICQDIIADPENSLGLLRRLHTFSLPEITTPSHPEPVKNDDLIRKLALLSQMAVFRDIIPGYRIRPLSDKEKSEKVSQIVQRTRDFEQGLVGIYQLYLRTLEGDLKAKGELSETALQCICKLLVDLTHFNFRTNLMSAVVARLSKKSWDQTSELCAKTLSTVFRNDKTGEPSLEVVRLLNRMIKERKFNVHPNVMFCLLDLRLKTELGGVRASQSKAEKEKPTNTMSKGKAAARRAKGKPTAQPHLSKAAKKKLKETREIEEEMKEAEAEVDNEEKANIQTETLKLVFVLYFRILKNDKPSRLLPAALQGISKYAHLVNVDFFKDLLGVLRQLVSRGVLGSEEEREDNEYELDADVRDVHLRLHCIVTAFELLSGQGEALNIDLTDFVNALYAMLLLLSTMPGIETAVTGTTTSRKNKGPDAGETPADMLFRALNLVFTSRSPSMGKSPPWRTAAFSKRLLTAALSFPPETARRAITFVQELFVREAKLESLLSTEDRIADGLYRPEVDDPQVCNPFASSAWEVHLLASRHVDPEVQRLATDLSSFTHNQS